MKFIAKGNTESYEKLLSQLNLTPLDKRRDILSLRLAKKCLSIKNTAKMFPLNKKSHIYNTRKHNKYTVFNPNTERIKKIANNLYATLVKQ